MAEINVKEAVKAAKDALLELYEDDPPKAMALEEIEKIKDNGRELWAVTLGFLRHYGIVMQTPNTIGAIFNSAPCQIDHRVYKRSLSMRLWASLSKWIFGRCPDA